MCIKINYYLPGLLIALPVFFLMSCEKGEGNSNKPPTVYFTVEPETGPPGTEFLFDASGTSDPEDGTNGLLFQWDWENDGSWDTPYLIDGTATHQYIAEGTYDIKMRVRDQEGLTGTRILQLIVLPSAGDLPLVTTGGVMEVTEISASGNGRVLDQGKSPVTARGLCWNISGNPTIDDRLASAGSGVGMYTATMENLIPGTVYFVRSYATNESGTGYGDQVAFMTTGGDAGVEPCQGVKVINWHGNTYTTVEIGSQCWMEQNLKDKTGIGWCYNDDQMNEEIYGRLYDWETMMDGASSSNLIPSGVQGICPDGWHIPSDPEWDILISHLGGTEVAGGKMKEAGLAHWMVPNTGATNESGFTALPGGLRYDDGRFICLGQNTYFWSCTESCTSYAWFRRLFRARPVAARVSYNKNDGLSVRCLKD